MKDCVAHNKVLPQAFVDDMRATYGIDVAERLVDALSASASPVSIRINEAKFVGAHRACDTPEEGSTEQASNARANATELVCEKLGERVPWCATGYYLSERPQFTFDVRFHAGAYYVQEASSMFIEQIIRQDFLPSCGECDHTIVALDLCAAPGGKSTLLRGLLPDGALLVCNEPMAKRVQVLAENMTKWGHADVVVTQSMPTDFTRLSDMFDLVVADVPCSGEGMFRKDDEAIANWSSGNVEMCWQRQRAIIADVWPALRAGGLLIYSTCTFNRREDEDNVRWIAETLGADVLPIEVDEAWGVIGAPEACHFLPGYARGEGFFAAALRKRQDSTSEASVSKRATNNEATATEARYTTLSERDVQWAVRSEHVALVRELRLFTKVLQAGVELGRMDARKGCFVPSVAAALTTAKVGADYQRAELDYETALRYLRGEAVVLQPDTPKGYTIVTYKGLALGFVKNIGTRANNMYPDAWRIRTTHLPNSVECGVLSVE